MSGSLLVSDADCFCVFSLAPASRLGPPSPARQFFCGAALSCRRHCAFPNLIVVFAGSC